MDSKRHGGNLNVFIFGVLVGVAATLLLTTKKGRKLLKVLTDEGADRLSQLENMVKEMEDADEDERFYSSDDGVVGESEEMEEGDDYVKETEREVVRKVEKIDVKPKQHHGEEDNEETPKSRKRLFRGIRKKTSKN